MACLIRASKYHHKDEGQQQKTYIRLSEEIDWKGYEVESLREALRMRVLSTKKNSMKEDTRIQSAYPGGALHL